MDNEINFKSNKRTRSQYDTSIPHSVPPVNKRLTIISNAPGHGSYGPTTSRSPKLIRGETLIYTPGTPISYTFHSCDATMVREALRLIHTEDLPLNLNLKTLTFSLPKHLDDNGSAISWLVSLTTCLAWCFHCSSVPDIVVTEPESCIQEPYIAVNEEELPSLRVDLFTGVKTQQRGPTLSTTATELILSFLDFTRGLPQSEMGTGEQAVFALADFLHNRPDKCKQCVLWRAAWKNCLRRLYGEEVAKSMARKRKFQPTSR
jgi:hypothetical protein